MSIEAVVRSNQEHVITVASTGRHDNLSDFRCSCGQLFVADGLSARRDPGPSLPMVHRAATTLRALGLPVGGAALAEQIPALAPGTVVEDAAGVLLRRSDLGGRWSAQDGRRLATEELNGPVTVLWTPDGRDRR